jgi:hypothetical protein
MTLISSRQLEAQATIRAELTGTDRCTALGIVTCDSSPTLALCRCLVAAGHDPASPMHVYRGDVLALQIFSIGTAAQLEVTTSRSGAPVFKARAGRVAGPPMRLREQTGGSHRGAAMGT